MRQQIAISVERLGKSYPVWASPLDALKEVLTGRRRHEEHAALADVSFRVRRGERVGIVGANGAGKSTLLKVLAGTVDHTAGRFRIKGELRAILELGTGFHDECSGRENILMGGLCLGYSRAELQQRTEWIIDFSELRHVIDRPLRTYSSGMKMRLMYAVAFCKPVEIMIIDEALATGDGAFVRKCTNHIVELCSGGTTALVVSHNLYFLERLCHRVIYLRDGRVVADGDPLAVCKQYEQDLGRAFVAATAGATSALAPVDAQVARAAAVTAAAEDGADGQDQDGHDDELAGAACVAPAGEDDGDDLPGDPVGAGAGDSAARGPARPSPAGYLRSHGTHGPLCGATAEPVPPGAADGTAFLDDRPLDLLRDGDGPGGSRHGNGPGEVLQPDGSWTELDFTGAPAVRHLQLVRLLECRLYDERGAATDEVVTGRPARVRFVFESRLRKRAVHLGFMIWNDRNEHVATTTNVCSLDAHGRGNPRRLDLDAGVHAVDVVFPSLRLGAGRYLLRFGVAAGYEHYGQDDLLVSEDRCLAFTVLRPDHVQTVHYEPHSLWQPLQTRGPVRAASLPRLDLSAVGRGSAADTEAARAPEPALSAGAEPA